MTNVVPLRPAARPGLVPVSVEWDEGRGLYVTGCERCCESATLHHLADADTWAETHHCDPELAALLAVVLGQVAA